MERQKQSHCHSFHGIPQFSLAGGPRAQLCRVVARGDVANYVADAVYSTKYCGKVYFFHLTSFFNMLANVKKYVVKFVKTLTVPGFDYEFYNARPAISMECLHSSEYYFEDGLRKVRPYYKAQ